MTNDVTYCICYSDCLLVLYVLVLFVLMYQTAFTIVIVSCNGATCISTAV